MDVSRDNPLRKKMKQKNKIKKDYLLQNSQKPRERISLELFKSMDFCSGGGYREGKWNWRAVFKFLSRLFRSLSHEYPCKDMNPSLSLQLR